MAITRRARTPGTAVPTHRSPQVGSGGETRHGEADRRGKTKHGAPKKKPARRPRSKQLTRREDRPVHYAPAMHPNLGSRTRFRAWALLARGPRVPLRNVERVTWDDSNAITSGSLALRVLAFEADSPEARLDQGDRVMLEASVDGSEWREVWRMRVLKPTASASSLQRSFNLVNDLDLLLRSEENFFYRSTQPDIVTVAARSKPGGWTGPEVIRDVCDQFRVPVSQLYTSDKKIGKLLVRRGSPLEVIRLVMVRERRKHNRRLVLRFDHGLLSVLPLRRSPSLLQLGPTIIEAAFQSEMPEQFASGITMHGLQEFVYGQAVDGRQKKNRQKMHVELESVASRQQFGYVHRIVFSPDARSDADLRAEGKAYLAAVATPRKTVTVTHTGMPWLRRGDAIQLALGDDGLRRQVCWVNAVTHQVSAQGYTMDLQLIFDDPYRDDRAEKLIWRLKATHDQAVGTRGPFWYLPKNKKADLPVTATGPFTSIQPGDPAAVVDGGPLPGDPPPTQFSPP